MKDYVRSFLNLKSFGQLLKVGLVGVVNTAVSTALFAQFRSFGLSLFWAVTVAFAIATFVSYVLNRRFSFSLTDGRLSGRETARFYIVNVAAWAGTVAIVSSAEWLFGPLTRLGEVAAYLFATAVILIPKFASYRDVVFGKALQERRQDSGLARDEAPTR